AWPLTAGFSSQSSDWLQLLLEVSLKGIIVLTVTSAIIVLVRRASAATRHLIWTLGIAGLLSLPLLQMILPGWRVPVLPPLFRSGLTNPETPLSDQNVKSEEESPLAHPGEYTDLSSGSDAEEGLPGVASGDSTTISEPANTSEPNEAPAAGFAAPARTRAA